MKVQVEQSVTIKEGRLYELLARYYSVLAADQGTWCELFKTEGYKRRQRHADIVIMRAHRMFNRELKRQGLSWKTWTIMRHGSNRKIDVQMKRNQYYRIVDTSS